MFSKTCSSCQQVKDLNEFSSQRNKPDKLYAWCDECRRKNPPINLGKANQKFYSEIEHMRDKAMQLRKFDNIQAQEIRDKKASGANVKDLASEYKTSTGTIYKVVNGKGMYGKVKR